MSAAVDGPAYPANRALPQGVGAHTTRRTTVLSAP